MDVLFVSNSLVYGTVIPKDIQCSDELKMLLEMGVIYQRIFPACESMCICCPALRSRSGQPVKCCKKLLGNIFPKSALSCVEPVLKCCYLFNSLGDLMLSNMSGQLGN